MKMLAAVLEDFNKLTLKEVPRPEPKEFGEVVVKIKSCGFCQTDLKAIKGIRRNVKFPIILGHEPSGIVTSVGLGVTGFREGDEVLCSPLRFCGKCEACRTGHEHYCKNAIATGGDGPDDVRDGAFAEYMLTSQEALYHKPSSISFDAGAGMEPLSGAWKGVVHYSQISPGDDVVVIGVGSIGLLCMMVASIAGAGRLVAVDISAYARSNALELGATHVVDPSAGDPVKQIYSIMPDGPDLIVEAAGPIQAVELMMALRRRGTKTNLFGITTHEKFELDGGESHFLESRMDASFGTNPLALTRAVRLMERGLIDVEKIISHRFPLEKIEEAVEVMAGPDRNKVIINC